MNGTEIKDLQPGDRVRLVPTEMVHKGQTIARYNGQVVFIAGAIPGEEVLVTITYRKKQYLEARADEVITPSPHRSEPPCQYYGRCGGCQFQHIDYSYQLEMKRDVVIDQLRHVGRFQDPPVSITVPCDNPYEYRNHARFTINKNGNLGFMEGASHRFLQIDECMLMHPWINETLAFLQEKCKGMTQMSVRYGINTGDWLIQPPLKSPGITIESGQKYYHESLLGHKFRVSSPSFFQVNTKQAEKLAEIARAEIGLTGEETLVDAYAGVGTFAALFSPYVKKVIAIEESAAAVADAKENFKHLLNVELVMERVELHLPKLASAPEVVLLDPPRSGCYPDTIKAILEYKPRTVVYISCDPATLARDLRLLCDGGYTLKKVQPVDMFPQTYHIECVASLGIDD